MKGQPTVWMTHARNHILGMPTHRDPNESKIIIEAAKYLDRYPFDAEVYEVMIEAVEAKVPSLLMVYAKRFDPALNGSE